ncbi:MAG TPA: hypothetical protein VIY48_19005 [Candidatus Paceibacterota bacterium]
MTVAPREPGGTVAGYEPTIGLEDVGVGDLILPRIQIVHDEGLFRDNLSQSTYESLDVILLGMVKQRIMWAADVDDGDKPMCKSPDFEHGFPNVSDETPKDKRFPWENSNFDPSDYPAHEGINGLVTLPCSACVFKEWGKNRGDTPPCAEQHTYPLLYNINSGEEGVEAAWAPALFTTQKTGIKPSRSYISAFANARQAMFTVFTRLSLTRQSRGSVKYSVPRFQRLGATDEDMWPGYGDQFMQIRTYIRQAPRPADDWEPGEVAEENTHVPAAATPPAAAPAPAAAAKAAPAAPEAGPGTGGTPDDELPF